MLAPTQFFQRDAALTDEAMRRIAPSIFAAEAHESRSARYTYVPTIDVVNGLRAEGFLPFQVSQSRARDVSRREFTKHMIRLRRHTGPNIVGQEVPEVILINSHDGTSTYQMMAGLFRFVCSNGMVVASSTVGEIRVQHSGDIVGRVIEGAFEVVKEFDRVTAAAEEMKAITLSAGEQQAFAGAALVAKYGEVDAGAYPVTTDQVLRSRRYDDNGADLWKTFNRVQENLVRGGLRSKAASGRRMRTREIKGINENVQLNRALWTLADSMAKLKA